VTVVVDSSVAAKWFLQEPGSPEAEALQRGDDMIAPDLIVAEVLNTIWKNIRMARIVAGQMEFVAASLPKYFFSLVPSQAVASEAGQAAIELDHPVYDCFYIALAARDGCSFVTADERLYRKTRQTRFASLVEPLYGTPKK
jgi:predicted nucleic acid-binding protein